MSALDVSAAAVRTIRRSALYDLIVTAPFATPWTARWLVAGLGALHDALGLPGQPPVLDSAIAVLLANLMGSLVVVWSVIRLKTPTLAHGATDSLTRGVFSLWMVWALATGASPLIASFLIPEILWGIVQMRAVQSVRYARA